MADGNTTTMSFPTPSNGISVSSLEINSENHLIAIFSDGKTIDVGEVPRGQDGKAGKSAYEIAVAAGYQGTESEWLESIKGQDGVSVADASIDENNHLIFTLSNSNTIDAGQLSVGTGTGDIDINYTTTEDIDKLFNNDTTIYPDPGYEIANTTDIDELFKEETIPTEKVTYASQNDIDSLFDEEVK